MVFQEVINNYPIFCGFYIDVGVGAYEQMAMRLKSQCESLGIDNDISSPESLYLFMKKRKTKSVNLAHWIYRYKPTFILEMLDKWKRPVLYLDADGEIAQKPPIEIFNMPHIGVDKIHGGRRGACTVFNVSVAAIYFNNTEKARELLLLWQEKCASSSMNKGDHFFFAKVAKHYMKKKEDIVKYFPVSFCSSYEKYNPFIKHNSIHQHPKKISYGTSEMA